ncbi:MAG TPA: hypothetical protein VFH47_02615 [Candidatus Thermoplasmatota archaeon]|nr:hypothetical protein [Candidatus Thermoplasmatota archaeon]
MADPPEWRIRTVTRTSTGTTHEVEVSGPDLEKVREVFDSLRRPEPEVREVVARGPRI